jgi:hypothetical protein
VYRNRGIRLSKTNELAFASSKILLLNIDSESRGIARSVVEMAAGTYDSWLNAGFADSGWRLLHPLVTEFRMPKFLGYLFGIGRRETVQNVARREIDFNDFSVRSEGNWRTVGAQLARSYSDLPRFIPTTPVEFPTTYAPNSVVEIVFHEDSAGPWLVSRPRF